MADMNNNKLLSFQKISPHEHSKIRYSGVINVTRMPAELNMAAIFGFQNGRCGCYLKITQIHACTQ